MHKYNRMRKLGMMLIGSLLFLSGWAQDGKLSLSIDEAVKFALQNNQTLKNAQKDVDIAAYTIWETASVGMPMVNASASLMDNLKIRTTLVPAEMFGGAPGTFVPLKFGTQFNTDAGFTVSQLVFSGSYWVGLQTLKIFKNLSEQSLVKAEKDVTEGVYTSYYMVLITEETKKVIEGNLINLTETYEKTKTMYSVGLAESTDVDQLKVSLTMLENTIKSMDRAIEMNYNLLKFQLGLDNSTEIALTENLDVILKSLNTEGSLLNAFNISANIDYQIMNTQVGLTEKSIMREKSEILPTISAFYNYQHSGMGDGLGDLQWFPSSMIGLQMDIPIFASGQRYVKIQKAKIELEKAKNNRELVKNQLVMQESQLRLNLNTAIEKFENQKESVEISKRIYENIKMKFEQGIVSSLDLTQANDNLLRAESNYLNSVMEVLQAKTALDKILNTLN